MAFNRCMGDTSKTINLANIPDDSISSIGWSNSPNSLFIAAGSWDKTIRIWQITTSFGSTINSIFKTTFSANTPVLSVKFSQDNTKLFAACADNTIKAFDLVTGNPTGVVIGQHQKSVTKAFHLPQHNAVLSGGWDGMVAIWDMRQQTPAWNKVLSYKIFAMDYKNNLFCVADNKLKAHFWRLNNLNNMETISLDPALKTQVRGLSIFHDQGDDYCGSFTSIGGRCNVQYFSPSQRSRNFSFKCHRTALNGKETCAYPVNAVDFYGKYPTFITGGADGNAIVWDKDNKTRVKTFNQLDSPIVDLKFNNEHRLVACATSYDWHKGYDQHLIRSSARRIQIVQLQEEDVKPKLKENTFRR